MTKSLLSLQMCCCDTRLKEEEQTISPLQQVNLTAAKIPDIKKIFFLCRKAISCLCFSTDGNLLATGEVRSWVMGGLD